MEKQGYIELIITGKKGILDVKSENYDIREIISDIQQVENLLFPGDKINRPLISYKLENGSVKHTFITSLQYIIGFTAILNQVVDIKSIDFLDYNTAKAIETFQETAIKKDLSYFIRTSQPNSNQMIIDKTTLFYRTEIVWADSEFYFYGKITNAGGKDKANVHLVVNELGTVIIQTPSRILEEMENNILYRYYGIRAIGKQNSETGEIDKSSLKFLDLIDYNTKYDEDYLKRLRKKAMGWLQNIKSEEWLNEIRGRFNA
ncbi:MAG: hypothetical protein A2X61_00100 [Ignavibacteria bacterium GWB2_35_12]|nr:MAG: hypothetical protein A2X63_01380 [Ignavibacteria bacterium GWA2_35_8]OGU38985.1 MAG: hypothetical protein A2X61_00100 [Ignavibacteria bacterium GWB2_35_12]OGU96194.1 MAG: hypothetical protein A2220_13480 [Ignavibacteria bacterium RIFOXYA2_FULL_35_10]OGV20712.1 MAG: hypothetical protein A2475_05925 [Ignavibacteria bacterium RIFOXYC2_FULL_35_21]